MLKVRFEVDGKMIESEGDVDDIANLIKRLSKKLEMKSQPELKLKTNAGWVLALRSKMPSREEVRDEIMKQPNYTHTIDGLQKRFFDTTFKSNSKETANLWHAFQIIVTDARKLILKEVGGGEFLKRPTVRNDGYRIKEYSLNPNSNNIRQTARPEVMLTQ